MKENKIIKLVLSIALTVFGYYCFKFYAQKVKNQHCLTTQISSKIFDFNTFSLSIGENLNLNDFKIVHQNSGNVIFENGKYQKGITNNYGNRIFEVYYKNNRIAECQHFSANNWYTFDYQLSILLIDMEIPQKFKCDFRYSNPTTSH